MALGSNQLFSTNDKGDTSKRVEAHSIQTKKFAVYATDLHELPPLTPVAFNTALSQWVPWDANGGNGSDTMRGLVWPDAIVLSDTDEVLGNVMLTGKVHYEDILAAVEERNVEVEADLQTELRSGPRDLGILVYGLTQVR